MNQLESLKRWTKVVADTANWMDIQRFHSDEATTNPSLILKEIKNEDTQQAYLQAAYELLSSIDVGTSRLQSFLECLLVTVGKRILQVIPGRVSTEVDARYSFDTEATVQQARRLIHLYDLEGISSHRVLIKIAATWEGIQAAKILEKEGIACNLTLIFSLTQAIACACANVSLISPFVGRIYDWYKARNALNPLEEDPGVRSVKEIYTYLKQRGYKTKIMGASFRNTEQILALSGCDLLTISPTLLEQLSLNEADVPCHLTEFQPNTPVVDDNVDEAHFRWQLNEDPMTHEKLAEGIRNFTKDTVSLEQCLHAFLERQG